jgi:hypothetical protein
MVNSPPSGYVGSIQNGVGSSSGIPHECSYRFIASGGSGAGTGSGDNRRTVGSGDSGGGGGGGSCGQSNRFSVTVTPNVVRAGEYVNVSFSWNTPPQYTHSYPVIFTQAAAPWDSSYLYIPDVFNGIVFRTSYDSGDEKCPKRILISDKLPAGEYEFRLRNSEFEGGVYRARLKVLPAASSQTQRVLPIGGAGTWEGRWSQNLSSGSYASTISISGNSLTSSFQYQNGHSTGTGRWNCTVSGNTARGTWTESYNDPDKSAQRRGTLQLTLSGDSITGQAIEDEPVFSWRTSPYSSAMRKGAVWPITLTRRR